MKYIAPHSVDSSEYLQAMIDTIKTGVCLTPVVVYGDYALTGSHRLAAHEATETEPKVIEITDEEYNGALMRLFYGSEITTEDYDDFLPYANEWFRWPDEIGDFDAFTECLYHMSTRESLRQALADQF